MTSEKKRKQINVMIEMKFNPLKRFNIGKNVNQIVIDIVVVGGGDILGWKKKRTEVEVWCCLLYTSRCV